jgi:hypothetical protein
MALSLEDAVKVKEKCRAESRKPKTQGLIKALFMYIAQHKNNPKLQLVPFDAISSATTGSGVVMADVACRLYGVFVKSPTGSSATTYFKITDDETTASGTAFDIGIGVAATIEHFLAFPDGKVMANGVAVMANTAIDGSTGSSSADRPSGFVIVGGS